MKYAIEFLEKEFKKLNGSLEDEKLKILEKAILYLKASESFELAIEGKTI